jgi:hypothetical protein
LLLSQVKISTMCAAFKSRLKHIREASNMGQIFIQLEPKPEVRLT